jgi:hypothetical protein
LISRTKKAILQNILRNKVDSNYARSSFLNVRKRYMLINRKKNAQGSKMKSKLLTILVVNLLLVVTILSATSVNAQSSGQWITSYTITDLRTGQILKQVDFATGQNTSNAPILAGAELNVTLTIQVSTTSPNTNLQLITNMGHSNVQGTYWELQSKSYAGLSANSYNPNQQTVTFSQISGTLVISCYGDIASGITQTQVGNGITIDKKTDSLLIKLVDPVGNQLDKIGVTVVDAQINQFDTLLGAAQNTIQTMKNNGVDPAYIALYQSVIDGAVNQANQGLVDNGIAVLTQLSTTQSSTTPISTGTPLEATLFIPAVGALVAIVVIVAFLFIRARGKVSYDKLVIEDQIKDLEGLTLRASKIDKNLTVSLESVKDRLKSLVGA